MSMTIELTQEQVRALVQIINRAQISGADAELIVALKQAVATSVEKEQSKK